MSAISRRRFLTMTAATFATGAVFSPNIARGARARVVIIGGGVGGATAARYLVQEGGNKLFVTVVEPKKVYQTCFFGNLYLAGFRTRDSIRHTYRHMVHELGILVMHERALKVDRKGRKVHLDSGKRIPYDRLIVSPGIDFKFDLLPGYDATALKIMPHSWQNGEQIENLKQRVEGMRSGGTFIMVPPPNPYRCPPGPYERTSMVAHIFKKTNPTAKILVLDPKPKFAKQKLFQAGWKEHYGDMIEWIPPGSHGGIKSVDPKNMIIQTGLDKFKADAACVVPPQQAGKIARLAGLHDKDGWCPIEAATMRSKRDKNIYILGDSSRAAAMPKSGASANNQAKLAARAVIRSLTSRDPDETRIANTCWSLVAENHGVKVGNTFSPNGDKFDKTSAYISRIDEHPSIQKFTFEESLSWYDDITYDMFGE